MKILLTGFMGSGKSYWAKKIAEHYKLDCFDLDELIEKQEKRSIPEIFENRGEACFRELERELLLGFSERDNFVLATGGGTLASIENMEHAKAIGKVIYLKEDFELLYDRINEDKNRPLAKLSLDELKQLLAKRELTYSQADLTIKASRLNMDLLKEILA
jgi:shikimate kinase